MKRLIFSVLSLFIFLFFAKAQTWTGNSNTDWNTGSNWSGGAVPLAGANVTIPTAPVGNRWPKLSSNISLSGFAMQAGAQLDINGFTITATHLDWRGSIGNSNIGTDIVVNITGTSTTFIRNFAASDHITYTISGTGVFYDTYLANTQNSYAGNATYNRTGIGGIYIGYYSTSTYGGDLTINRVSGSEMESFYAGANIAGNLNVTSGGGTTVIGDPDLGFPTRVGGVVNFTINSSANVGLYRIINQTNGGSISISDRAVCNLWNDTLKLTTITITGNTSTFDLKNNDITGNLSYASSNANAATHFVRSNKVIGSAIYTLNGTGTFYDNYLAGTANNYSDHVIYQRNGAGATYIGYYARNTYNGNVTISNNVAAILDVFEAGADVAGNLSYSSIGGTNELGEINGVPTYIGGTLNMTVSGANGFGVYKIKNNTPGGSITATGRTVVNFEDDTLMVNNLTISEYTAGMSFSRNQIVGNLSISRAASNSSTSFVRNVSLTGNAVFTMNGTGTFYDSYLANTGSSYTGNVTYNRVGTGAIYVGYYDTTAVGGNLTFNYNTGGSTVDNRYLLFNGTANAVLSQEGNAPLQFYAMVMQKQSGAALTLDDSVRIIDNVRFETGNVVTSNQKELIWLNTATADGANDNSKVVGPAVKIGAQLFTFPVGNPTHLQGVAMTAPSGTTSRFRAQYYAQNPHPTFDTAQRAAGLARISTCEYWQVLREVGTTNVTLTFQYGSPCACVEVPANLRVARWSGSQWLNLGNGATTGNTQGGTVQTVAAVADYGIFSLGTSAMVSPTLSIGSNVSNPVCLCRKVTFTATATLAGCTPSFQWKKNNTDAGTNSPTYEDSTLQNGDVITCIVTSSAAFAQPASLPSNSINITTTDANSWTGATSSNWHTPANWSCQSVPCIFTKVTIAGSTPSPCEILSGNVRVVNLTNNANSVFRLLNGATLELKPAQ